MHRRSWVWLGTRVLMGALAAACGGSHASRPPAGGVAVDGAPSPVGDDDGDAAAGTGDDGVDEAGSDNGSAGKGSGAPDGGPADDSGSLAADGRSASAASPSGPWVIGYYSNWNAATYPVDQIEWGALTHIATAFALPDGAGGLSAPGSFDPTLARIVVAAAHGAGKRALASIGGADSSQVFEGSTTPANLAAFVANVQSLVTAIGYDGVDLDWEGGPTSDGQLLLALVQALRAAMPGSVITLPVPLENLNQKSDLSVYGTLAPLVDRVDVMSYNASGAYAGWNSWHSSPLHWNGDVATPAAIDVTVRDFLAAGVPRSKLGVGTGFFGECYSAPITAPDEPLAATTVVQSDGVMTYSHILDAYFGTSARHWDATAMVPYLSFSAAQGPEACTYVSYEDAQSIAAKAAWVKANGLGGTIVWTLNEGYVPSAPAGQRNPLLDAVREGFLQ